MEKIVIFGCGNTGIRFYNNIKEQNKIVCFFDNDKEKDGKEIDGIPVYFPTKEKICLVEYDRIYIASAYGKYEMREQLKKMGINESKIEFTPQNADVLTPLLNNMAELFEKEKIVGNCAEVGVFRGENAWKINAAFPNKKLYLFDTFEGFADKDVKLENERKYSNAKKGQYADTSVELVMSQMKYPENIIIKKGYFPDSARGVEDQFCFVRIDLDLYKPTVAALDFFYPMMQQKGIVLVHDYFGNNYNGIQEAVDLFMEKHSNLCKMPIGDTMSIAIMGF